MQAQGGGFSPRVNPGANNAQSQTYDSPPIRSRPRVRGSNRSDGQDQTADSIAAKTPGTLAPARVPAAPELKPLALDDLVGLSTDQQYLWGQRYLNGEGAVKDHEQAFHCFALAAIAGMREAQFSLGVLFESGLGCKVDAGKARLWFQKAAAQGSEGARQRLDVQALKSNTGALGQSPPQARGLRDANLSMHGQTAPAPSPVPVSASEWLKDLLARTPQDLYAQGQVHLNAAGTPGHYGWAFQYMALAAYARLASAQSVLAEMFEFGYGLPADQETSIKWCRKAAQQGNREAMLKLAYRHEEGNGLPRDLEMAQRWYAVAGTAHEDAGSGPDGGQWMAAPGSSAVDSEALLMLSEYLGNAHCAQSDLAKALACLTQVAESGSLSAQLRLAALHAQGIDGKPDLELAQTWYGKAAWQGSAQACKALAEMRDRRAAMESAAKAQALFIDGHRYQQGKGWGIDKEEAFKCFSAAAALGHADAQCSVGRCYLDGSGVAKDVARALECFRKAADRGSVDALFQLGFCHIQGIGVTQDDAAAFRYCREAAMLDHTDAIYNLGYCFAQGYGVAKDERKAFECYVKAADRQHRIAEFQLGCCYAKGAGVLKSENQAVHWYRKAARQGLADAQHALGVCYRDGTGVARNAEQAATCFQMAAEQQHADAQIEIGLCCQQGAGSPKDPAKAAEWFGKAAMLGQPFAQFQLGCCYLHGSGIAKDDNKAREWFAKGAERGNSQAQLFLGYCYAQGIGVKPDMSSACEWYERAVEQGNTQAHFFLAEVLNRGVGVVRNRPRAIELMRLAARQGDQRATDWLERELG